MKYLAPHNPKGERTHLRTSLTLSTRALFACCGSRFIHLTCALLPMLLIFASSALAQSGRKTQTTTTNPSSTQRPRRATSTQEKTPAGNTPASGSSQKVSTPPPTSVLPDDAPPAPARPRPTPQPTAKEEDIELGSEDVLRITSNLVTVPASIVDTYGKALAGLKLEDFELRVDGQVKAISEISYSDTPVRLALLFDNSSSLTAAREFEKQAAIRFFRTVMRPVDQAAIYNVYTDIELSQPLTSDVRSLVRTIENFGKPEGATRLFDAIVQAANYLRPQPGRKVIVIVSDGEDTLSDTTFDEALRIAQASDCQIYAVQTKQIEYMMQTGQPGGNANLRSLAAERRMQEFSAQTGGAVYSPLSVNELDAAFSQISADLAQQYILSYYPVDEKQDGRFRAISLRVVSHPNARVRARKGYYASKSAMRSSVNWQTTPDAGGSVAGINASDTVPSGSDNGTASVSSNASNLTPASDIKIVSTVPPSNEPPPPQTVNITSEQPAQTKSQPVTQPEASSAQSSTSQQTVLPTQVSGGVLNGRALRLPKPDYPATARAAGASGTVTVEVTVDETGKVIEARAISGHPMLKPSATAAARQARFAPTKLSGQPVKVTGIINYNFALPR